MSLCFPITSHQVHVFIEINDGLYIPYLNIYFEMTFTFHTQKASPYKELIMASETFF